MENKILLNKPFQAAAPVLDKLIAAGYEAYFVGGSVRDVLLGKAVNDVDIATSAFPSEVKAIFPKTIDVGIEHGTVMVLLDGQSYEITTFRTESAYQDFRRPDSVTFVRSLKEDLKRRDFTINALALSRNGDIHDYFKGQEDLENRLIKAVGTADERFQEDALRMMRAARFASQLGFSIEDKTTEALKNHAPLLQHIAIERIQIEFVKMVLGNYRYKGLKHFIKTGLFKFCPGMNKAALEQIASLDEPFETERQVWSTYLLLARVPLSEARTFLRSWKLSNKLIQEIITVNETVRQRTEQGIEKWTVYTVGKELSIETEKILNILGYASDINQVKEVYEQLPIYSKKDLALTGNELMKLSDKKPGKWLGDVLDQIEKAVVYDQLENDQKAIITWIKEHQLINE